MAFENVNVSMLKSSIITCENELNTTFLEGLINNIKMSDWTGNSKNTLISALDTLNDVNIKKVVYELNSAKKVVEYIEEYKQLQQDNNYMRNKYYNLQNNLYKPVTPAEGDSNGSVGVEIDYAVDSQMKQINSKTYQNEQRMNVLVSLVENI